jgi:acetoin utilization protein AcuB
MTRDKSDLVRDAVSPRAVRVGDVMTRQPAVTGLDTPLRDAVELMRSKLVRHLPVVDQAGHVLGIVTDRDLRHAAFVPALAEQVGWELHRAKAPRVRDVMTWSAVTTHEDTPLVQAALLMFQRRIGSLPVVADGRLVGILTERDVWKGLRKEQGLEVEPEAFLW